MKSKVRSTLLFVVLFVIATTSMFAATRAFDDSHINVTIQNAGPGGVVVIGSTVKVTLTDPEYSSSLDPPNEILSAAVDFRLFGGIEADAMSWDPVLLKWKKDFVVQAGTINTITPTAKVKVRGFFRSGGESIIPDDALFIVNNIAGVLSLLPTDIITTVTPAGTAIVGSVIAVQFTSTTVTSASANFISFGGPVTPMVKTGDTFTASYTVVAGTIAGSFKVQIIGYNTGNPNPGVASDNDNTSINNVLPSSTDILGTHLEVNNTPALAMMKIGDTIHVKGTFKTTGSTIVSKVWINWGLTFTGGPITEYPVVAGVLNATYVPASGSLPANTANLLVKITKLQTVVGNFANGTWNVSGNGATPPVPIVADLMPPSILGVRDLWYDFAKPLRFSPVVTAVDGHATQPNDFAIFLTIPNWGAADGTKSFTLKFTSENRDEFMRTYSVGDAAVTSVGADLKVIWDGKNAANAIVADPLVTTYGITLWEIKDAVGNGATLTHIVGNEFSPTGVLDLTTHYNVQSGADNWVGNTILNRIHVVADNVPLGKNTDFAPVDYTVFTAANPIHLVRLIDDANNSNSWNSGEDVRYIDASGTTINTLNFNFQLLRAYSVDTNPKRHEEGKYWAVMESGTSKWLYNGATWVTYPVAFNQDTNSLNVPFVDQTALSNVMSLSWNTSSITDFPGAVTAGTPYKLYAYFQDNAGNIVKSQEVNVKIEHRYVHMPIISDINIISLHDGGTVGLPPLTAGIENFYMTSAYTPGGDHSGNYYVSTDIVSIEILINNRDNLTTADQAVSIQNTLGGTVPATIWLKKLDFVDNPNPLLPDRAVVNIQVANMNKISGALAPGKQWTVGGPVLPNNYMKVTAYPLATNPFITNFVATGSDKFNLVIPEEPVWPSTDLVDYALTATPDVFSPGNPINTYDAVTNPANDANTDETNFSFTIPLANRDVTWTLRLENLAGTLVKSWTGNLAAPELPYTSAPYNFTGLKDDLTLVTPALATEDLNLKLIVQPAPYGDTGYTAPPTTVVPSKVVTIDNINPTLATGAGSSFAANKVITLLPAQPTPVVTQTQRDIAFTLHTSEYLDATILNQLDPIDNLLKGTGWNIQVLDSLGVALMNGALPVTATINTIVPANGNKTFAITATLNNLAGDFTAKNAKLHIRLPWDKAKNPARYNNPSFPYNADVFSNDSAEGFLTLHILNAKPRINDITFTNKTITGTAGYAAGTWNTAITQAWVRDGGTTPPLGNFTMVATVTGGAYRAMNTSWTANLQPLLGGTGTANTAVVPVATSTVNPINESIVWTLTWTGNIPTTVASAWTHNQALTIPISIITSDGSNPAAHTETQSIVVRVDKAAPVASTTATEIVADGNAKAITFSVVDNPGSGVYWNTVVGNPYGYVGESLVLSPNTGMTVSDTGDGTFTIAIPATTTINKFTATYTAKDHMGNQVVYVRYLNVTPKPKVKDVKIVMTPPATLHVPGNAMLVRFNVENRTRVENLQITFTGTGVSVVGGSPLNGNPQTITLTPAEISGSAPIERSFNVVAADASTLTATITGTVTQYTDAATGATTPPTAINYGVGVDADNIDTIGVDTKPIIQAVSFYHNNQLIKSLWKDDYINNEYVNVDSIVIKVLSPSNLQNPVFKLGAVILPNYTSYIAPVNSNNTHYYKWVNPALNPSLTALSWSAAELAEFNKIADFTEDIATIHGYNATKWNHGMALLREPEKRVWGVTDPNGWFAPEHQVKAEYKFSSLVNTTVYNSGIIAAEFDAIEDNIVDNWKFPDQTGGLSRIAKTPTFLQGLTGAANNTTVNFWRYTTTWTITNPDVQSIWNNYADGQQVAVDFRHQAGPLAAVGIGNNTIYDTAKIKVDEKVPVYENQFNWATATGATAPATYYSETSMVLHKPFNQPEPVNNITVPLDANNKWANGKSIYVKYYAKDGSGVGLSSITTPTATGGWAVVQVSQNLTTGEKVIKISKSGELTNPQPFVVTFGAVQDSVGHFNYAAAGSTNSTDPEFRNLPPTLNISFAGDYAIGLTLIDPAIDAATRPIRAYQVFDTNNDTLFSVGELTDWRSAPYIKPGQKMGFMLKPDYPSGDRGSGVDVDNITVDAVFIDVSKVLNKTAVAANWQPLTKIVNPIDPLNKVWYLTNPQTLDIAYNNGEPIEFRYKINYRIPYLNPAIPDDIVPFEPTEPRNAEAFADKQSPVIQSVMVASESYFNNNHPDGYVVVDDENGTITIKFTGISVPGIRYTNLNTKPAINITGLNRFVSQKMGTPIIPVAAIGPNDWDLSYDIITNVWTGTLDSLKIIAPASAPFDGSQIAYTVTDVVGNAPHTGNRMVEIINSPIVPYIIRAEVVSSWDTPPAHSVSNYIVKAPGLTNELRVYINTAHQAYIEDMSVIGAHNGITFGAMTIAPYTDPLDSRIKFVAKRTLTLANNFYTLYSNGTAVNIEVKTIRHPYGADVFEHTAMINAVVDGDAFQAETPLIYGISVENPTQEIANIISTMRPMKVSVKLNDLSEAQALAMLTNPLSNLLVLSSIPAGLIDIALVAAPAVTVDVDGNHTAVWDIPAAAINDSLGITQAKVQVVYNNVYGISKTVTSDFFFIDNEVPIVNANGIQLLIGANTYSSNYNPAVAIAATDGWEDWENWTAVKVYLKDMPSVNMAGLYQATLKMQPQALTYQDSPAMQNLNMYSTSDIQNDANGSYLNLNLATALAPYTVYDLAVGFYNIKLTNLKDRFGNVIEYTQPLYFNPDSTSITLIPINASNQVTTSQQTVSLRALVNDPTGTVNGVQFRLYYDIDADGVFTPGTDPEYASDIIAGINGNPDMTPPFQAEWNLTDRNHYSWAQGTPYDTLAVRNFFVRVSAITGSRYVTDQVTMVQVTDNVPPVPVVQPYVANPNLTVHPNGAIDYDYNTISNNSITLKTNFVNWPDAYKAIFEISKVGSTDAPVVIESAAMLNPTDQVSVIWNYGNSVAGYDPTGTYKVDVKGLQYAENRVSISVPTHLADIVISNPANNVSYGLFIDDIITFNNEVRIGGNAVRGNLLDANKLWANPFTNLRLNASFNSLQGISKIRFHREKFNLVTGTVIETTNITTDQAWQADYVFDADGYIPADQIVANNAYVFLNESDYQTNNNEDIRYNFWVELIPTHAVSNDLFVGTASLTIDNRAPQVAITDLITPVSWFVKGQFKVEDADAPGYDIADIVNQNNIHLEWYNATDDAWYPAVFGTVVSPTITADYYTFKAWNIAGGSVNTFLGDNYAGAIQIRVVANDSWGNTFTSPVALPVVDNKAPVPPTRFTHVIHSYEGDSTVSYPTLTVIPDVTDAGLPMADSLNIVTSTPGTTGSNGSSNLQLFVDANSLGTVDTVMPLIMYHQTPDGVWSSAEFDHEAWNLGDVANPNLYEFVIPSTKLVAGTHRFVVVRKDAMGNLEGDIADNSALTYNVNGHLTPAEKDLAVDLIVYVTNIDDVIASIQYPADLAFIGGRKAITAIMTPADASVSAVQFQNKVGNDWVNMGIPVPTGTTHPVTFDLLRSDVPQYNALPWVPGVHLFNGGTELGELMWNGTSWTSTYDLTVGTAYSFQYGIDLNNNGIWETGEPLINDPKGFTNFTPTAWTLAFNSNDYAQGLHEFRAVPLKLNGDELAHYQSPSSWMIIDNVKPVINGITTVGNITNVTPGTGVPFVTDVTALLVATDDIVNVRYEYSGQPVGTVNRKWGVSDTYNTSNMSGNYPYNWTAVNPLTDNVDNNGNGLVDEAAEANGTFFVRAIASDRAGNFQISNEFAVHVDGSAAEMALFQIEDTNLAATNYIYQIDPSLATVWLSASELATGFDPAVSAKFFYKYIADIDNAWPGWTQIGTTVPVTNGVATTEFGSIHEGYYQFMVTAYDALGNNKSNVTTVIFNDVTGPEITFTAVGTIPVISEKYAFAQVTNDFNGSLTAVLSDITGVSAVTFEYSNSGLDGTWVNITTTNNIPASGMVTVNWTYPPLRAPLLYLKAIAQDANANNMQTEIVKLYHDTTAPSVDEALLTLTHTVVAGMKVIDIASDIEAMLTYTNLVDGTINDVNSVIVRLVNNNDGTFRQLSSPVYNDVNMAATSYIFTPVDLAGLANGTYRLEIQLTDFAGNASGIILPVAFQTLYNDTMAPANLAIASITYPSNVAVYNAEDITFRVNYTDLIGVAANGAMTATLTSMGVSDVVTAYTIDTVNNWIDFTWNPSAAMEQFIINGAMNIPVGIEVAVSDLLGQTATLTTPNNYFTLTYGIPNVARVMAVTDMVEGNRSLHYVNWNITPAQVVEMVGTNHTIGATPDPLKVYAYVPHMSEVPQSITMSYRVHGSLANPTLLGTAIQSNLFDPDYFLDPNFFAQFQQQYVLDWDISALNTGAYEIITTSNYISGNSSSSMLVNIYNGTIVPTVAVAGIAANGNVERGDTYTLGAASYTGSTEYLSSMVYQYRYVNPANGNSPTSQWMYFGDINGNPVSTWITDPYTFDWTVYPYYLHNNTVQIVGFAKDKWGTETPISSIISGGAYAIAHITDTTAPAVATINVNWNGLLNPAWLSGVIAPQATVMANVTTNINPNDLDHVEFYYNNVLIATETGYQANNTMNNLNTQAYPFTVSADVAVVSGVLKVMAYDVYGNVSTTELTINIDNTLPTANLAVTLNGTPITALERETTVLLNANAADAPAGVASVAYAYAYVEANPTWIAITPVEANGTANWLVPADLEYGHDYTIKATVTDLVGHVASSELTFEVSDINTEISIVSVVGHTPVNDIIPIRLHGDFPVVTNVPANQNIPRLAWYVRTALQGSVWNLLDPVLVTELFDYTTVLNLDTMPSGDYYLGVGPADRTAGTPVDQVMITLDNIININGITSIPATDGSFNGDSFVVNFTIASDDEIVGGILNQVKLSYAYPIHPTNWMTLGNANILNTLDGVHYTATFEDINIMHNGMPDDGYYLFRLSVQDLAIPTPNVANITVATNVLYDVTLPNVAMTSINGVTDMLLPINIDLGTTATIEAAAYDALGGQTHQVASGIQKLEFYYNYNGTDVMISEDATAPYAAAWNTTGLPVGTYNVTVKALDNAGNEASVVKSVTIGSPTTWQPFAMVTAMNFDGDTANQDAIYTVVDTWANETINGVTFEYTSNGTTWTQFATATNMGAYWKAMFNAELMTTVTQIRTVVNYNDDLTSTNKPVLAVTYSALQGGSLVVTTPTIMPSVYYNNEVRVTGAVSAPRVTTMFEDSYVGMPQVQMVNGNQTAFFNVNAHGEYNFWAAAINYDTWMMQLNKATLNTHNIGTVASNGISTTVPANSFVYFETVMPTVALEDGFTALSLQNAVLASPQQDLTLTVTLNATPTTQGTIVGMYYDGAAWISVPATVNANNTVTFDAPSGYIYAVAQYTGVTVNTMFVSVDPQYVTPQTNAVWTLANTTAKFLVYTGMNQGGYETPMFGEFEYQMYLDNMLVIDNAAANYTDGIITYNATGLAAGLHTARVMVTMDGFNAFAEKQFNVEITEPVIVATGTQLNINNRTISATITDPQTGIADAYIAVTGWGSSMTIPMENLVVNGNVYSYSFTMDDLNALGYDVNYTEEMVATWHASNNLLLTTVSQPINYTVNIEGPAIAFTGFTNGWWLNPTFNTPLTFTVTVPTGRTIPVDGVMIDLQEVTAAGNNQIQYMTLAPVSVAGNVYSYSLNFGQMLSPLATAVKLEVEAIDNYNIYNGSEQTYGLDMAAPVVWAMAPIGAPIDNDGDGLFNEDAPNGVNEDLDWVDLNHNGFWDAGEPQIVDEDPIDFMPAVIPQGTNVVVALGFEDYSGLQYLIPGTTDWYYTGQSGINAASVAVTLNGSTITGTITNGTFTHNAGVLEAGHYTVVASVPDVVGNVGSLAFEFNVVGGAPSITINALGDGNYWLNSVSNNTLTFTVESEVQLANGGVVANVYTVPANVLLQGPMTLNAVAGIYSVNILGGLIPANQTGIRLEVIATDVWGGSSTANQVFGIDNNAPVINLTSPVENAQFVMNATVNIMATITDQTTERVAGIRSSQFNTTKDRSGSGIDNVTLTVIAPDGTNAFEPIIYPENTQVIMKSMPAAQYGTYIINLSAKDGAGNQSVVTRNFIVTPATGPTVTFNEIANGWLNSVGMNNLGFTVNSPVSVTVAANVYTYPSEALLMGPLNVNPVSGLYTVALNGGMIPADQTSVRLQVMVTDQFGNVTEANNYYSVDKIAPTITILTPANGAEITLVDEATKVRIDAQFSDTVAMLKATSGSGIAMSKLIVIDPLGAQVGAAIETGAGITETTHEISNLMLGTYTVRVTVWDNAGNQAMASVNFTVVAIPAPPANLEISEAHAYPNPMDAGLGARFSISLTSAATVNVRIYDFAGREVRSMDYAGRVEGKSTIEIVFDGRNNNGEKLARGTYFARVIANDGKKIVEKVVKIAIKK